MTDVSERRFALADELIEAARDKHRAPGAIFYSDVKEAFDSIAGQLHRKKVPAATVATIMRDCAASFEHGVLVEFPWDRNHQVTVEPSPKKGDGARDALVEQLRRMEQLVKERRDGHRLSQAYETMRAEVAVLDEGGAVDRAEAMISLARVLCDTCDADDELPF